ncbi:MAG: DUF1501 domain-containing protein, partial [Bacteroidota bacterium]
VERSAQTYSERISQVFNAGSNSVSYPNTLLADQLKTIARFISGGSRTKVFFARFFGWDTHGRQVVSGNTTEGRHANLLAQMSQAIKTFQTDLKGLGLEDRVTTLVFSEFGRKIKQNGGYGTDHGTLSTMYAIGKHVKAGVYGDNIDLSDIDVQGAANSAQMQYDYRTVFSSFLKDWMGADSQGIQKAFKFADSQILLTNNSFVEASQVVDAACSFQRTAPITVSLRANLMLEGFYQAQSGNMDQSLVQQNLIPKEQPYGFINYRGDEQLESFPAGTVDWVLCELRSKDKLDVISQKAVLIRDDGALTELDGDTILRFPGQFPTEYRLAIYHRSHVPIISSETTQEAQTISFNFDNASKVMGQAQLKNLGAGVWGMISGDLDQNGLINAEDYHLMHLNEGRANTYLHADINGDGRVNTPDAGLLDNNRGHIAFPDLFPKLID